MTICLINAKCIYLTKALFSLGMRELMKIILDLQECIIKPDKFSAITLVLSHGRRTQFRRFSDKLGSSALADVLNVLPVSSLAYISFAILE